MVLHFIILALGEANKKIAELHAPLTEERRIETRGKSFYSILQELINWETSNSSALHENVWRTMNTNYYNI